MKKSILQLSDYNHTWIKCMHRKSSIKIFLVFDKHFGCMIFKNDKPFAIGSAKKDLNLAVDRCRKQFGERNLIEWAQELKQEVANVSATEKIINSSGK